MVISFKIDMQEISPGTVIPCVRKVAVHLGTSRSAENVCE